MLGAALNAHGEDSANLDQDNVDVSSPSSSSIALMLQDVPELCCICLTQQNHILPLACQALPLCVIGGRTTPG